MTERYLEMHLWRNLTENFLERICKRCHYKKEDMPKLRSVACDMMICLKGREAVYIILPEESTDTYFMPVVMTLGEEIDLLEARYQKCGRLQEAWMLENLSGELLMCGYEQLAQWVREQLGLSVRNYHFFGSNESFLLEQIPEILRQMGQKKVTCTADFCLRPQKSTVFLAELKAEKTKNEIHICGQCQNRDFCTQRMGGAE